ncbi:MAG: c-type cytochrome [Acidobacteria bacterium]|nr:c-type cytochrome [Acidobacteriota bacterium]
MTRLLVVTLFTAFGVGTGLGAQVPAPGVAPLPQGTGVEVVRARCLSCHASDLIESQRLTRDGWAREIDKMVRWGASVPDADRAPLLAYLATHFSPAPAAVPARATGGEAIFKRACLACHGADLSEQQRLSVTGWTREVEKMMRWGASVTEAEKAALVEFLAATYPIH